MHHLSRHLCRHFASLRRIPNLSKIPSKHRPKAIEEAQQALTDYFHSNKSVPYTYAEHIAKNSLFSLSYLIRKVPFSNSGFRRSVLKFLWYHPVNEFEFFFESIGIDHSELSQFLPEKKFFFSEDGSAVDAAFALSAFGFPWNKLGKLFKEEASIFTTSSEELNAKLSNFKNFGFENVSVIGICLAFPSVLRRDGEMGRDVVALFDDLKRVFLDFDLGSCIEANVDSWYDVCRKIKLFYDLGCEKGKLGEIMGKSKNLFLEHPEEVLVEKAEYFCKFCVRREDVGLLILQSPEVLKYDLETRVISVMGILKHFGLGKEETSTVALSYPYVFGRNTMANLPYVMRALDLHEWFFNRIKDGNHLLLGNYALSNPDEDLDKNFIDGLEKIQSSRTTVHTMQKLSFLHRIGYGENASTIKVLDCLHGTATELQERFDCLLSTGIEFSKLCMIIKMSPKILNQKPETLEQKVKFLCDEMNTSLDYLQIFPAFLCFDLENRVKPRYRFHKWLTEKGLCTKNYSIASMVATSEKSFLSRIYGIHPAALKQWLEYFSYTKPSNNF